MQVNIHIFGEEVGECIRAGAFGLNVFYFITLQLE